MGGKGRFGHSSLFCDVGSGYNWTSPICLNTNYAFLSQSLWLCLLKTCQDGAGSSAGHWKGDRLPSLCWKHGVGWALNHPVSLLSKATLRFMFLANPFRFGKSNQNAFPTWPTRLVVFPYCRYSKPTSSPASNNGFLLSYKNPCPACQHPGFRISLWGSHGGSVQDVEA